MSAILKFDFQKRKQLRFSEVIKLSKLHKKDTILHVTTTVSLKQGETRTSSGPIPHPLTTKVWRLKSKDLRDQCWQLNQDEWKMCSSRKFSQGAYTKWSQHCARLDPAAIRLRMWLRWWSIPSNMMDNWSIVLTFITSNIQKTVGWQFFIWHFPHSSKFHEFFRNLLRCEGFIDT